MHMTNLPSLFFGAGYSAHEGGDGVFGLRVSVANPLLSIALCRVVHPWVCLRERCGRTGALDISIPPLLADGDLGRARVHRNGGSLGHVRRSAGPGPAATKRWSRGEIPWGSRAFGFRHLAIPKGLPLDRQRIGRRRSGLALRLVRNDIVLGLVEAAFPAADSMAFGTPPAFISSQSGCIWPPRFASRRRPSSPR